MHRLRSRPDWLAGWVSPIIHRRARMTVRGPGYRLRRFRGNRIHVYCGNLIPDSGARHRLLSFPP